uniref:Uncharacterized protein n=1 Tax=Heterorhabditis bacteriophora TaxID=37862 RepID=A0A1I7WEQ2_HETBA
MRAYIRSRITTRSNCTMYSIPRKKSLNVTMEERERNQEESKMIDYTGSLIEPRNCRTNSGYASRQIKSMMTTGPPKNSTTQVIRETVQSPPEINRTMMTLPQTKLPKFDGTGEWRTQCQNSKNED